MILFYALLLEKGRPESLGDMYVRSNLGNLRTRLLEFLVSQFRFVLRASATPCAALQLL